MRNRRALKSSAAVCATAALALLGTVVGAPAAQAEPGAPVDLIYTSGWVDGRFVVRADGGGGRAEFGVPGLAGIDDVSPDGTRLVGHNEGDTRFRTVGVDGRNPAYISVPYGTGRDATFSPDGSTVYFTADVPINRENQSRLLKAPANRDGMAEEVFPTQATPCDSYLSTSTGKYAYMRHGLVGNRCDGPGSLMLWDPRTGQFEFPTELGEDGYPVGVMGEYGAISPDGTRVVYLRVLDAATGLGELRVLDLATKVSKAVYRDTDIHPAKWSPDGKSIAFGVFNGSKRVNVDTGRVDTIGTAGVDTMPVWANRTVKPSVGVRVYGSNAITTGVATSRFKYDDAASATGARRANVAVLTRSDAFYDGLAGAGLAGAKGGPMLLTPKDGLAPSVSAELARILAPGSTVYVLGDEGVVGAAVDTRIRALGLVPKRLAGRTVAETGVAIAAEMTSAPKQVYVATAAEYYDALAAGAAAGSAPGSTVVFSWGDTLPTATRAYLNGLDRTVTKVTAVGGPAVVALNAAGIRIDATADGRTAPDTARLLAERAFVAPRAAAVATMNTWQDALTGGALIAGRGPLLLANRTSLPQGSADYLLAEAGSLTGVVVVGGSDVVTDEVAKKAAGLTGPYGTYDHVDSPDGTVSVPIG